MISVIIPIYKVEQYLRQCIESVLIQTYRDLEILLIDDGSPDKCGNICEEYAKKDKRIRVFHTENKGLSAARNLGLHEAKGEYIGFVDSDDWIEPNMYEILLRQIEKTGSDISTCGVWKEFQERECDYSICNGVYVGTEAIRVLMCNLTNAVWNKLYKRSCWTDISFPENHTYEEFATSYKVFLKAHLISCIPKQLYHYRMRDGSIDHIQSMNNLIDCWNALYDRYLYLKEFPVLKNDQEFIDNLEKSVAFAAVKIWRWTYRIPKEQKDYTFLYMVSNFVRNNFPFFGKKNWGFLLCTTIVFPRFLNEASFAILHTMSSVYSFLKHIHKTPFPSC